jgi:hypothetical protein
VVCKRRPRHYDESSQEVCISPRDIFTTDALTLSVILSRNVSRTSALDLGETQNSVPSLKFEHFFLEQLVSHGFGACLMKAKSRNTASVFVKSAGQSDILSSWNF